MSIYIATFLFFFMGRYASSALIRYMITESGINWMNYPMWREILSFWGGPLLILTFSLLWTLFLRFREKSGRKRLNNLILYIIATCAIVAFCLVFIITTLGADYGIALWLNVIFGAVECICLAICFPTFVWLWRRVLP